MLGLLPVVLSGVPAAAPPVEAIAAAGLSAVLAVVIGYVIADRNRSNPYGPLGRGFLIGLSAGLNGVLLTWLIDWRMGVAGAAVNLAAAVPGLSALAAYRAVLGWSSWVLPMSWLATGVGLVFAGINGLSHLGGLIGLNVPAVRRVRLDGRTGVVSIEGGAIVPFRSRGFNLGSVTFVRTGCEAVIPHEAGHALNVAAMGGIFHYVGAIDENVPPLRRGQDAYAEIVAESWGLRPAPQQASGQPQATRGARRS